MSKTKTLNDDYYLELIKHKYYLLCKIYYIKIYYKCL